MASPFFGLQPEDKEALILEPSFLLMYHCGFSLIETMNMPVSYKRWFLERISKEYQGKNAEAPTRAAHQNTPEIRSLQGMNRDTVPSRLRRFT